MKPARAALSAIALAMAAAAGGEVRNSDPEGFAVGGTVDIAASPEQVWAALGRPADWWDKSHTYSGRAENLSIQLIAGGCFCERLGGGGGVEHLHVVQARPASLAVFKGELGPLQSGAGNGALSIALVAHGAGTGMTWTYEVSGLRGGKGLQLVGPVDQVMSLQMKRLGEYAARRASAAPRR